MDAMHSTRTQTVGVVSEGFMTGAFLLSAGISTSIETYVTEPLPGWFLKMMFVALQIPEALSQRKYFKLKNGFVFFSIDHWFPPSSQLDPTACVRQQWKLKKKKKSGGYNENT